MESSSATTGTRWEGLPVLDREGAHLGSCVRAFEDSGVGTTVTEWVVVDVDTRGPSVLPARDAKEVAGRLQLDVARAVVLEAPQIGDVTDLTDEAVAALAFHYALPDTERSGRKRSGTKRATQVKAAAAGSALPRLAGVAVLLGAVAAGLRLLTRRT